jgi:hypothetical protein
MINASEVLPVALNILSLGLILAGATILWGFAGAALGIGVILFIISMVVAFG